LKETISNAGSALALLLYAPTLWYIWTNKLKQSFATWILWVALDAIAFFSIHAQSGENTLVLKCYILGGSMVWSSLLIKKQFKWTRVEWLTLGLVVICLEIWVLLGAQATTVASTVAVCVAAWPQYRETYHGEQDKISGFIFAGYTVVNLCFFLAGETWAVKDWLYGGMVTPLCGAISWAAYKRRAPIPLWLRSLKISAKLS
jgi:hypothetical protein